MLCVCVIVDGNQIESANDITICELCHCLVYDLVVVLFMCIGSYLSKKELYVCINLNLLSVYCVRFSFSLSLSLSLSLSHTHTHTHTHTYTLSYSDGTFNVLWTIIS